MSSSNALKNSNIVWEESPVNFLNLILSMADMQQALNLLVDWAKQVGNGI